MALTPVFRHDGLSVHWVGGGLYLQAPGEGLLIDAPVACVEALQALGALPVLHSILLASGRPRAVAGIVPLLCALEPHRRTDTPLCLRSCLQEERGVGLASAWSTAWSDRYPLLLDGIAPGESFETGPFEVVTVPVRHGEPRWNPEPAVEAAKGVAVRVRALGAEIAWVPGAAPGPPVRRVCRGADLAVVEVGVERWPSDGQQWRMTVEDAVREATEATEVWLVGDDGRFGIPGHRDPQ